MPTIPGTLRGAADLITRNGLHHGEHFIGPTGRLDVCAAIYTAAEHHTPRVFRTDAHAAFDLIEASPDTMAAIVALSNSLDTEAPTSEIVVDGQIVEVTEYVDHIAGWVDTPGIGETTVPDEATVIGRLLRLADTLDPERSLTPTVGHDARTEAAA